MRDMVSEALKFPIADIGQIDGLAKKALDRAVRAGGLKKWRGYWHPVAGAAFGIGPLKTCYGTWEAYDMLTSLRPF